MQIRQPTFTCVALLLAALCSGVGCRTPKGGRTNAQASAENEAETERSVRAEAAFATGIIAQLENEGDTALDWFQRSLEHDPAHEALALDIARRLFQRKEYDQAVRLLQRVTARPDASAAAFSLLAAASIELGNTDAATAALREAVRREPASLQARRLLVQMLLDRQKPADSLAVLDEAAQQASDDPAYWSDLADLYFLHTGRLPGRADEIKDRTTKALQRAVELKPSDPLLLQRLGERFADLGQYPEAEKLFLQLRGQFPNNPLPAAKLAEIYIRTNRRKEAQAQLEVVLRENRTNPLPWYYLGAIAFDEQQFDRAVEMFERATLMDPNFEPAYLDLASAQLSQDRPADALATLDTARTKFKPNFRVEFLAGVAASRLKRYEDAVRHFAAAETNARTNQPALLDHRFYFQFGATCEQKGDSDLATKHLEKALELRPDFADALNHLGYMWADKGLHLERSHEMIRKAVEQEPENEAFLDSLAWVLFKLGKPAEALPWMEKALRLAEKSDATLYDHLGDIFAALGRTNEAKEAWRKSLSVEKSEAVQKKLEAAK